MDRNKVKKANIYNYDPEDLKKVIQRLHDEMRMGLLVPNADKQTVYKDPRYKQLRLEYCLGVLSLPNLIQRVKSENQRGKSTLNRIETVLLEDIRDGSVSREKYREKIRQTPMYQNLLKEYVTRKRTLSDLEKSRYDKEMSNDNVSNGITPAINVLYDDIVDEKVGRTKADFNIAAGMSLGAIELFMLLTNYEIDIDTVVQSYKEQIVAHHTLERLVWIVKGRMDREDELMERQTKTTLLWEQVQEILKKLNLRIDVVGSLVPWKQRSDKDAVSTT